MAPHAKRAPLYVFTTYIFIVVNFDILKYWYILLGLPDILFIFAYTTLLFYIGNFTLWFCIIYAFYMFCGPIVPKLKMK